MPKECLEHFKGSLMGTVFQRSALLSLLFCTFCSDMEPSFHRPGRVLASSYARGAATLTLECAPARASPNRDRRRIASLADEDQLAIERFDDGNTTGPGLDPRTFTAPSEESSTLFTFFRDGKAYASALYGRPRTSFAR